MKSCVLTPGVFPRIIAPRRVALATARLHRPELAREIGSLAVEVVEKIARAVGRDSRFSATVDSFSPSFSGATPPVTAGTYAGPSREPCRRLPRFRSSPVRPLPFRTRHAQLDDCTGRRVLT